MLPVVLRGNAAWPAPALPVDEFAGRVTRLQERLGDASLAALLVPGDSRAYGDVCYLSGFIPMTGAALVLAGRKGPPRLYVQAPERNLPDIRGLTWLDDVRSIARLEADLAREAGAAPVGLVDGGAMRSGLRRRLLAIEGVTPLDTDSNPVMALRRVPRERERGLLRDARRLTLDAADAAEREHARGAAPTEALLVAEQIARERGAHGVRALYSPDGGRTLRPFTTVAPAAGGAFAFYLAVDVHGYWGETLRTAAAGPQDAEALEAVRVALAAAASGVEPGAPAAELAERLRGSAPGRPHPALAGRLVARLGLERDDRVGARSGERLDPGVYSLRLGVLTEAGGVLASTTVDLSA